MTLHLPALLRHLPLVLGLSLSATLPAPAQAGVTFSAAFTALATQGASQGSYFQAGDQASQTYIGTPFLTADQVLLDAYFTSTAVGAESPLFEVLLNGIEFGTFYANNTQGLTGHLQFFGAGSPVPMTPNGTWNLSVVLVNGLPVGGGSVQFLADGDHLPKMTLVHDDPPPTPGDHPLPLPGTPALVAAGLGALGLVRRRPAPQGRGGQPPMVAFG